MKFDKLLGCNDWWPNLAPWPAPVWPTTTTTGTTFTIDYLNNYFKNGMLSESEKDYKVEIDLPGFLQSEVDVNVGDHYIAVSAKCTHGEAGRTRISGHVDRSDREVKFTTSLPMDKESAVAELKDGVLTVIVQKAKPKDKTHKVTVK